MAEMMLSELCAVIRNQGLDARLEGADCRVRGVNTLEDAAGGELSFVSNPKYAAAAQTTGASALVCRDGLPAPSRLSVVRSTDPYAAVTVAIVVLHGHRRHPQWGVSERAVIDPSAKLGKNPNVGPGVTIAANVQIGNDCTLYPGCYVAAGARMGDECVLYPNVVVYDDCELGHRVTVHAGSVIGEDGLGYAPVKGAWLKIPQVGRAVLGDDVEIGANCAIDRATLGRTEIGAGTKFGNEVVIGHGTKIGRDCLFVGQVGVAGSVTIGRHVTLAGQVGVAGHCAIGDDVQVGAQAGISGNVEPGAKLLGSPAIELGEAKRSMIAVQKLPDLMKRVKELERQLTELKSLFESAGKSPLT